MQWDMQVFLADRAQAPQAGVMASESSEAPPSHKGGGSGVDGLVCALLHLARQARALELASHLIHLNFEGREFLEVHGFLKTRYETHLEQFDALAEFVRTLDYLVPWDFCCSLDELSHPIGPGCTSDELLLCYLRNLEEYGMAAKGLVDKARSVEAPDVENYAAELVADSFKAAWFLKAMLRGC